MPSNKVKAPCSFDGCGNPWAHKGLCFGHLAQLKAGKPLSPLMGDLPCDVEGCDNPRSSRRRTKCEEHFGKCSVDGCSRPHSSKGFCHRHYYSEENGYKPKTIGPWSEWYPAGGYMRRTRRTPTGSESQAQHRVIMEKIIGRELLPNENVHHKNGMRRDNRPENLELWITSQPSGQRPADLVAWANEILECYSDLV